MTEWVYVRKDSIMYSDTKTVGFIELFNGVYRNQIEIVNILEKMQESLNKIEKSLADDLDVGNKNEQ